MSLPPPSPPPPPATEEEEEEEEEEERTDDDEAEWEESEDNDDGEGDVDEDEEEEFNSEDEEEEPSEEEDSEDGEEEDDDDVGEGEAECRENGRRGGDGLLSAAAAVAEEEHGAEAAGPSCCVCMEPWTCDGAHRICCIPCGHVYGRSCLEKWLLRCGNTSAKCPQCGQRFRHKHITNLYVPGNVSDGFCRLKLQMQELIAQLQSEIAKAHAKFKVDVESDIAKVHDKLKAELVSHFESIQQSSWEELARDVAAAVEAEFLSMKEKLMKMADEQNATPMDMLRFMEQNGAKLWESIGSRPLRRAQPQTTTMED